MNPTAPDRPRFTRPALLLLVGLTIVCGFRLIIGERSPADTGLRAVLDAVFAVALMAVVLQIARGLGAQARRKLRLFDLTLLDAAIFDTALGLGVLAYGMLVLGLLGGLQPAVLLGGLAVAGLLVWQEIGQGLSQFVLAWSTVKQAWRKARPLARLGTGLLSLVLLLTIIQALSPTWDVDALIYHLQGPKLFLQAGRLQFIPDNWLTNYPFTIELLFTLGLSFGSDAFARVLHVVYSVGLIAATYTFARRILTQQHGLMAAAILIGIPIVPLWASAAYVDMAWALYTLLSIYAVRLWIETDRRAWLVMAGVLLGLALGIKYFALAGLAAVGLWVVWHGRTRSWPRRLLDGLVLGISAALVAAPWYLKSWLWTGNPIYPLLFGGLNAPAAQVELWTQYMRSFGTGRELLGYLLLPLNVYAQYARFGTFLGSIEIPSPLFGLALLYPLARKGKQLTGVAGVIGLLFLFWMFGSQQTRFLLPLFPLLSVLASAAVIDVLGRWHRLTRVVAQGVLAGLLVVTLIYSVLFFAKVQPLSVVLGVESKAAFLQRMLTDYAALQFVEANLSTDAKVLMLWDGQGYYCDARCQPDIDHAHWTVIVKQQLTVEAVTQQLKREGVTHLLFNLESADFIAQHDPTGDHRRAAAFLFEEYAPACLREVFRQPRAIVFEVTCP